MYKDIDMSIFPDERKQKLEQIYRYHIFEVMFYRSNLEMHNQRVLWLLEELAPLAQKHLNFDMEKARIYALVHDDAEIVTGDVQAIKKARMSPKEVKNHEKKEALAIDELTSKYPETVHGYSYKKLLKHASKKNCIEAQLVSYVDKLDAFCESLHEVYAGNISFLRSVVFYATNLPLFPIKYPKLKPLLSSKESPLTFISDQISPYKVKALTYSHLNKPHTKETVLLNTDFPFYKTWKKIMVRKGKIDWLVVQKEFLP